MTELGKGDLIQEEGEMNVFLVFLQLYYLPHYYLTWHQTNKKKKNTDLCIYIVLSIILAPICAQQLGGT